MPRLVSPRSLESEKVWASKSDLLAQAFALFVIQAVDPGASAALPQGTEDRHTRVAVAADLCQLVGLQAFVQLPQTAANPEIDDALLLPFV